MDNKGSSITAFPSLASSLHSLPNATSLHNLPLHPSMYATRTDGEAKLQKALSKTAGTPSYSTQPPLSAPDASSLPIMMRKSQKSK
ncbi:hypothetical protein DL96DRAFT_1599684 [Flagelloscypha sp. PMI_526]|nr:hypothetical protein DL96DRAFT_1599684 [Flagelloscypha sp. PMI_526]